MSHLDGRRISVDAQRRKFERRATRAGKEDDRARDKLTANVATIPPPGTTATPGAGSAAAYATTPQPEYESPPSGSDEEEATRYGGIEQYDSL